MLSLHKGAVFIGALAALLLIVISYRPDLAHPGTTISTHDTLLLAIDHDDLQTIEMELSKGVDVNTRIFPDTTLLMSAAAEGRTRIAQTLLNHGADITVRDSHRWTALHLAVKRGNLATVDLLLQHHAEIDARNADGDTPLLLAAKFPFPDLLPRLLAAGADLSARNNAGQTPITAAISHAHMSNVVLLASATLQRAVTANLAAAPARSALICKLL